MSLKTTIDRIVEAIGTLDYDIYVGTDSQNPPSIVPQIVIYNARSTNEGSLVFHEINIGLTVSNDMITLDDNVHTYKGFVDLIEAIEEIKRAIYDKKGFIKPNFSEEKITDLDEFPKFGAILTMTCEEIASSRQGVYK